LWGSASRRRLRRRAARTLLVLGECTRLTGAVTRVRRAGGLRVRIEADDHPCGRFRTLTRVRTRRDGTYATLLRPAKNVRLRAVLERARPTVRTASLTVWTELPIVLRRLDAGGRRPRVRVTLIAPPRAGIRHHRAVFYLAAGTDTIWQRVAAVRWQRRDRFTLTATGTSRRAASEARIASSSARASRGRTPSANPSPPTATAGAAAAAHHRVSCLTGDVDGGVGGPRVVPHAQSRRQPGSGARGGAARVQSGGCCAARRGGPREQRQRATTLSDSNLTSAPAQFRRGVLEARRWTPAAWTAFQSDWPPCAQAV
jgi:hypothetical protein